MSSYFSTIKEQRSRLISTVTLPIFNLDLIILRASISSICNDILNLNFTKLRSIVIRKLPSASVNSENQNKKSSFSPVNLGYETFADLKPSILDTSGFLLEIDKFLQSDPILFLLPDTLIDNNKLIPINRYR